MKTSKLFSDMRKSILEGDKQAAEKLAWEAVRAGLDLAEVLEKGYIPGIREVGELWEQGIYFLPELVTGAECMQAAMRILQPHFKGDESAGRAKATIIIGTIEGDIHDIGKNLVASMLSANGFEVIDLGADVPIEKFIETARQTGSGYVCLSALLTTTMMGQKNVVERMNESGLSSQFKIMVGGAPVTQEWAQSIGADGYAENAMAAVEVALSLLSGEMK